MSQPPSETSNTDKSASGSAGVLARVPAAWHTWLATLGAIAGVLTAVALLLGYWLKKPPQLEVQILGNTVLTEVRSVPNLSASFKLNGIDVNRVNQVVLRVLNPGDSTLVFSQGSTATSAVVETISVAFEDGSEIMSIDLVASQSRRVRVEPPVSLARRRDAGNIADINFRQLQPGDEAVFTLLVRDMKSTNASTLLRCMGDPINGGYVFTTDKTAGSLDRGAVWTKRLSVFPRPLRVVASIMVAIGAILCVSIAGVISDDNTRRAFARRSWKRGGRDKYQDAVKLLATRDPAIAAKLDKESYEKIFVPDNTAKNALKEVGYEGPLPPHAKNDFSTWQAIAAFAFGLLTAVGAIIVAITAW